MSCDLHEDGKPDTDDTTGISDKLERLLQSAVPADSRSWSLWPGICRSLSLELCKAVVGVVVLQIEEQRRSKEPLTAEDIRVVANALFGQLLKPALHNRRSSGVVQDAISGLSYEQACEIAAALVKRF